MEAEKATKRTSNSSNTRTRRSEVGGDFTARPVPQRGHCRTSVAFSNPQFGQVFAIQIIRFRLPAHRPALSSRAIHHLAEDGFHFMARALLVLAGDGGH